MIIIVTGLPRSGTSLMMQLLEKCNIPIYADFKREKDINNPEGYYELEAVKGIVKNNAFLKEGEGKALKVVAPLPMFLDKSLKYKVIFMRRDMEEILRSQEKMLEKDQSAERQKFATIYEGHLAKTYAFLNGNSIPFIDVQHRDLIQNPEIEIQKLIDFLEVDKSVEDLISVVKPDLYRNRN